METGAGVNVHEYACIVGSFFLRKSCTLSRLLDGLWLVLLCGYVLAGTPLAPFHADEATQIAMSRDYATRYLNGDPGALAYRETPDRPDLQELRLVNGSINKDTMGLAWHLAGYRVGDLNEQWDWGADWDYNVSTGHAPSPGLLQAARWPSALLTAAGVVLVFALGHLLDGRAVAYVASAYYALNPAILLNGRRAMMEGSLLFFGLLAVVCALLWLRRRSWSWALAFGAAAGLALSAKHTNAFVLVALFAACALVPVVARLRRRTFKRVGGHYAQWMVAGLVAAPVFFVLNPVWWGANPLETGQRVLQLRADLLAGQTAAYGSYDGLLDQLAGFGRQALVVLPQYYEDARFANWIADQIALYEASPWHGVSIGGSVVGALAVLALAVIGAGRLLLGSLPSWTDRWVVGAWGLAALVLTCLLTPLEWQRYYLPVLPALGLLAALGVGQLVHSIRRA